jgi:hypothetical protein
MFTFTAAQKIALDKWVGWRAEQFLQEEKAAKEEEAKKKEDARLWRRLAGDYSNDDDDDDAEDDEETRIAQAWELVKSEAENLSPDYLEIYGGEEFKSFIAQDISVLCDHYPDLLLHARMRLNKTNERKAQKKRKLDTESAGGSAAGGSAAGASAAGASAAGASAGIDASISAADYEAKIKALEDRMVLFVQRANAEKEMLMNEQCKTAEDELNSLWALLVDARAKCESVEADLEKLSSENKKLLGREPDLSEPELEHLLKMQEEAHKRTLKSYYDFKAREKLAEDEPRFVCSINGEVFRDPVVAEDGNTYERTAIERWIQEKLVDNEYNNNKGKWNSPLNGLLYTERKLFPNTSMKTQIFEKLEPIIDEMVANKRRI